MNEASPSTQHSPLPLHPTLPEISLPFYVQKMSEQVNEPARPRNVEIDYTQQAAELDAAEQRYKLSTAEQELNKLGPLCSFM